MNNPHKLNQANQVTLSTHKITIEANKQSKTNTNKMSDKNDLYNSNSLSNISNNSKNKEKFNRNKRQNSQLFVRKSSSYDIEMKRIDEKNSKKMMKKVKISEIFWGLEREERKNMLNSSNSNIKYLSIKLNENNNKNNSKINNKTNVNNNKTTHKISSQIKEVNFLSSNKQNHKQLIDIINEKFDKLNEEYAKITKKIKGKIDLGDEGNNLKMIKVKKCGGSGYDKGINGVYRRIKGFN